MTTNREWLYGLDVADLAAWFDAEHEVTFAEQVRMHAVKSKNYEWWEQTANRPIGQSDARETPETAETDAAKCEMRDFDDSREKLEADVMATVSNLVKYCDAHPALFEKARSWLDRQEAITEREHPGLTISDDESLINWRGKNYLLQSRVLNAERERDEFSLKLKHEMELNRNNRNALDLERIDELQAKVDELKSRHCPHYHVDEHRCDVHETRIAELTAERDALRIYRDSWVSKATVLEGDVDRLTAERDELREKLSQAIGHASDIIALQDLTAVDVEGEVR